VHGSEYQNIINENLKNRKLDTPEGLWQTTKGKTFIIYKINNEYFIYDELAERCGLKEKIYKEAHKVYRQSFYGFINKNSCDRTKDLLNLKLFFFSNYGSTVVNVNNRYQSSSQFVRLWPDDLETHNSNFKTDEDIKNENKKLEYDISEVKKRCSLLGFKPESEKFKDCSLQLYSKIIEEKIAEKQLQKNNELLIELFGLRKRR
tara:strand:+ start:87 stop:698 length:612 start_codon:yes stop_codon:yes gene_type:complete